MNIGQLKKKTIQIIREYSNNGAIIGKGDNQDYLLSIPGFISDAQMEISNAKPILVEGVLEEVGENAKYIKYKKPIKFRKVKELSLNGNEIVNYKVTPSAILIPKEYKGKIEIIYCKNPDVYDADTDDLVELEIDTELQYITSYKAAYGVIVDENPEMAAVFLNEYNKLVNNIKTDVESESSSIIDMYGVGADGK